MKRKIICLIIIFLLIFLLGGCWDKREPESLAIVVGIGFDFDPEKSEYKVIAQIINPLKSQGGSGGEASSDKPAFWTVSGKGSTIIAAITNLRGKVSRELFYAHTHLELFSTTILEEIGIIPVLDALERTGQTRPIILMAATDDDPKDILTATLPIESINVLGIRRHIEISHKEMAGTTSEKARDFLNNLSSPGIEPVAVKLALLKEESDQESSSEPGPGTPSPIKIVGKVIFRRDKAVGDFDLRETRGCNWIIGEIKRANLDFTYPEHEDIYVSVLTSLQDSSFEPILTEKGPRIKLKVKALGRILNITGAGNIKAESDITESLERRMAAAIHNDIQMALDKARKLKSDVFGFGNSFYRKEYKAWLEMEDNWTEIFVDLPVDVEVEAVIERTGLINKVIRPR